MPPWKESSEAMLTIFPRPRGSMCAPAARESRNTAVRLISITASQSSSECSTAGARRMMPALFTRISTAPIAATASSITRSACARELRSAARQCVRTPAFSPMRFAVSSGAAISCRTTSAPAWAKPSAIAAPNPRLEPVTRATLPSRRNIALPPRLTALQTGAAARELGLHIHHAELPVVAFAVSRHHPQKIDLRSRRRHIRVVAFRHHHYVALADERRQFRLARVGVDELHAEARRGHVDVEIGFLQHRRVVVWRP